MNFFSQFFIFVRFPDFSKLTHSLDSIFFCKCVPFCLFLGNFCSFLISALFSQILCIFYAFFEATLVHSPLQNQNKKMKPHCKFFGGEVSSQGIQNMAIVNPPKKLSPPPTTMGKGAGGMRMGSSCVLFKQLICMFSLHNRQKTVGAKIAGSLPQRERLAD